MDLEDLECLFFLFVIKVPKVIIDYVSVFAHIFLLILVYCDKRKQIFGNSASFCVSTTLCLCHGSASGR